VLLLAVFGISWAAPLIRLSDAPPLVIATWRLVIAVAALGTALSVRGGAAAWRTLGVRGHALAAAAGVMLAFHFWSWNASLLYTTVAASVVLVNLQPAIVAAGSALLLCEPPSRAQLVGMVAAIVGAGLVAVPDVAQPPRPGVPATVLGLPAAIVGDALAVLGALTASAYYLVGRRLRATLDLLPYVVLVYGWCLAALVVLCLARGEPLLPWPEREWGIFAALAAGPMLLGHTGMNWALRHLPAHVVNLTVLGEPVGASLLAMLLPAIGERPGGWTLAGGACILAGALLALRTPATAGRGGGAG
jgi:drug/metabolite transporter (DMT)-like permease